MAATDPNFGSYDIDGTLNAQNGGARVRFYRKSVKDEPATEAAGRPIFKDVDYIQKMVPGDAYNIVNRPVRDYDKEEFPVPWAAYARSLTEKHEGTDLAEWPSGTRSQVENLKYQGVFTVEELADLDDKRTSAYGVEELRERARDYITRANFDVSRKLLEDTRTQADAVQAENDSLRAQLADAQAKLDDSKKKKG